MYPNNENIKNSREAHPSLSIYDFSKAEANIYKNDKLSTVVGQKLTNIFKGYYKRIH